MMLLHYIKKKNYDEIILDIYKKCIMGEPEVYGDEKNPLNRFDYFFSNLLKPSAPSHTLFKSFEYVQLAKFLELGFLLAIILLVVGLFVSPRKIDNEKLSAYECGFEPFESARIKYNIHYYLIAILFIIFDAEIIFLFPWTVSFSLLNIYTYPIVLFFVVVLTLGFVIEWVQSLLKW